MSTALAAPVGSILEDDDREGQTSTRKRVFDVLSQSLSQTGRKKKHKKYPHLYPLLNAVTLHTHLQG
jgi:hypothetical protein